MMRGKRPYKKCNKKIEKKEMLQNIVSSCLDGECPGVSVEVCEINLEGFWGDRLVMIGFSIVY